MRRPLFGLTAIQLGLLTTLNFSARPSGSLALGRKLYVVLVLMADGGVPLMVGGRLTV
jgi:hypothetical protein